MALPSNVQNVLDQAWSAKDLTYTLSPKEARALLGTNKENRSMRRANVDKLKKAINNGDFVVNGDTIVISTLGTLLNGQHRLEAIASGNTPVNVILIKDVDPSAFSTIDSGVPRSLCDYMNVYGADDHSRVAMLLPRAERWDGGQRASDVGAGTKRVVNAGYIKYYENNRVRIHAALRSPKRYVNITEAETSLFRYIIGEDHASECDIFLHDVDAGIPMNGGETPTNIRNARDALQAARNKGGRGASYVILGILLTAWNAKQNGRCIRKREPFEAGSPLPNPIFKRA